MADGGKGHAPGGGAPRQEDELPIVRRGRRMQRRRRRSGGWTPEKKAAFLTALSETCNIREAARTVGMSKSAVYALRARDPGFRQQWEEMIERGYAELELCLLQQMLEGTVRTEMVHGVAGPGDSGGGEVKQVRTVHSFPLSTMVRLWVAHRGTAEKAREREGAPMPGGEEAKASMLERIRQIRAQWGDARALAMPVPEPGQEDGE